jgi:hypothetical protein
MTSTSVVAIDTGAVYLLGVARGSSWFPALTVATSTAQTAGFLIMMASGRASASCAAGAVITAGSIWWDKRRAKRPRPTTVVGAAAVEGG